MTEVFIKKDDLNRWVAKYFDKDLISINDLIVVIEELDEEKQSLEEQIEYLERPKDDEDIDPIVDEMIINEKGV